MAGRKAIKTECLCQHCGKSFLILPHQVRRKRKLCGRACQYASRPRQPLAERFWAKVEQDGPVPRHCPELGACWTWTGRRQGGYGRFDLPEPQGGVFAHRVAYELLVGAVPAGLQVLHRCDNPSCVNPAHLFVGTHQDNMADRDSKGRGQHGERHSRARLSEDSVRAIRARYAHGGVSWRALGREYGVARSTIQAIIQGTSWKHVMASP